MKMPWLRDDYRMLNYVVWTTGSSGHRRGRNRHALARRALTGGWLTQLLVRRDVASGRPFLVAEDRSELGRVAVKPVLPRIRLGA